MTETQQSICEWIDATFGPASSNFRIAVRADEEMAELLRAVATGDHAKAAEEAADVVIVLARLFTRLGKEYDLSLGSSLPVAAKEWYAVWANSRLSSVIGHVVPSLPTTPTTDGHALRNCLATIECLVSLAGAIGFDLQTEIDKKMAINRAREWRLDGSGHGYHVKKQQEGK